MTTLFETKEQYLNFRKAWADAVNSPKAKKTLERHHWGATIHLGWVQSEHMVLCNILRQRAFDRGFTPVTSKNKLENGAYINYGLYEAVRALQSQIKRAQIIMTKPNELDVKTSAEFLEPFAGTVTAEMLAQIELPKVELLESAYGKGQKLARAILAANVKPITYQQMWDLYEVTA